MEQIECRDVRRKTLDVVKFIIQNQTESGQERLDFGHFETQVANQPTVLNHSYPAPRTEYGVDLGTVTHTAENQS